MHGKLHTAAALDKDDMIVVGNGQELLQHSHGVVLHGLIGGTAMTDFNDTHSGSIEIEKFVLHFFQYFQGHCRWTGIEIVHSFHVSPPLMQRRPQG